MRTIVPVVGWLTLILMAGQAQAFERDMLAVHNQERARWGIAPLTWSPALAAGAAAWANEMARTDRWGHSPRTSRPRQGENLSAGFRGRHSAKELLQLWVDERRDFRPGIFPNISATGYWKDAAHYTQMIARRTREVGCAYSFNQRRTYLVCHYYPSGNVDGQRFP